MGSAVLTSIIMASKGAAGSQVIICTDGEANTGIGRFSTREEINERATKFYQHLGEAAYKSGVMVNLVTIEGTQANI